jgi:hypothetical protein
MIRTGLGGGGLATPRVANIATSLTYACLALSGFPLACNFHTLPLNPEADKNAFPSKKLVFLVVQLSTSSE